MIKSKLKPNKTKAESEYPKLMEIRDEEIVVLFERSGEGAVVYRTGLSPYKLGYYSDTWVMRMFKPYNGKVVLG